MCEDTVPCCQICYFHVHHWQATLSYVASHGNTKAETVFNLKCKFSSVAIQSGVFYKVFVECGEIHI